MNESSCIDRWIKSNPKCPQCNMAAKKTDIRRIYASKSIRVQDTSELERALKELEHERQERKRAEMNASDFKINFQLVNEQLLVCRKRLKELEEMRAGAGGGNGGNGGTSLDITSSSLVCTSTSTHASDAGTSSSLIDVTNLQFVLEKTIDISTETGCRVLHFSERLAALLVSAQGNNVVFAGYGIKKVNIFIFTRKFRIHITCCLPNLNRFEEHAG